MGSNISLSTQIFDYIGILEDSPNILIIGNEKCGKSTIKARIMARSKIKKWLQRIDPENIEQKKNRYYIGDDENILILISECICVKDNEKYIYDLFEKPKLTTNSQKQECIIWTEHSLAYIPRDLRNKFDYVILFANSSDSEKSLIYTNFGTDICDRHMYDNTLCTVQHDKYGYIVFNMKNKCLMRSEST